MSTPSLGYRFALLSVVTFLGGLRRRGTASGDTYPGVLSSTLNP